MKKFISIILATLLIFSVMAPITVFAENGPYPNDLENVDVEDVLSQDFQMSAIMFMDFNAATEKLEESMGLVYPADKEFPLPSSFAGASYDIETNTLTLKNVKAKTAMLCVFGMGDDFKINLIGYNEFACIMSIGMKWGGSVTLTGNGELVIGRSADALITGITLEADDTASVFHVEDEVKLKVYSNPDYLMDAISVVGSTVTDPAELIKLGGTVVSDEPVFKKYIVDIYEQLEAYDLEWNNLGYYEIGLEKDGAYYVANEHIDEETFEYTGKYDVYTLSYDDKLECYVATDYAEGEPISLDGFTTLTEYEPIYDEKLGYYISYTDYSEEYDGTYKEVFYPYEKESFNICVDANGTKYGFWQYAYEEDDGTSGTDTYVYNIIEHPTYGYIAVEDETKTTLNGLTPLKIGEKELADSYISSDVVINNGGAIVEPATINGIELKNTNQGVKISWEANSTAEKYRIYRKKDGANKWSRLTTIDADETFFFDETAKSGTKYYYTVRGYNFVGWGDYNEDGIAITHIGTPEATAKNTSKGIYLKWTKIANAEKYKIYRQTEGSSKWKLLDTTKKNTFTDKTAKSGTKYYYRVKAAIGKDISSYETVGRYYLSTPKLSSVKNSSSGVKVTWEKVTGAEGYKIYRKTSKNGDWKLIDTTTNNKKSSYTDKTAKSGKTYYYSVQAYYSKTTSTYDKTGLKHKYLATPKITTKVYASSIKLSWKKIAGAKKYAVYRKADGETKWTKLTTTEKLYYKDSAVKNNKTYSYRVKAINEKNVSSYKTVKQLFLKIPKLSSIKNTNSGVKLTWKKVSGAESYKVYRKTGSGDFKLIATTKKTSYTDSSAKSGTVYTYTVKACKDKATGYYNKTGLKIRFVDTNALYTPDNVKNGIQLRWEPADKADKYYVYRKVDGEKSYKQIDVVSADELKKDQYGVLLYVDKTAKNGTTYFYNLKASYKNTLSDYASSTGRPVTCIEVVDVTSAKATSDGIKVKWEKSPYATGYRILRKEKGVDENYQYYSGIDGRNTTTYLDKNVESGKTYTYAIQAIHDENDGKGGWSAVGGSKSAKAK